MKREFTETEAEALRVYFKQGLMFMANYGDNGEELDCYFDIGCESCIFSKSGCIAGGGFENTKEVSTWVKQTLPEYFL